MKAPGFSLNTNFERLDPAQYSRLEGYRACDLSDAMHRSHTMIGVREIYTPVERIVGPAATVAISGGGFEMILLALSYTRPGDILVIAAQGYSNYAHWGAEMSEAARELGILGVVIDGAARDSEEVQEMGFPVFATATATGHTSFSTPWGEINAPVSCGAIVVSPGDIVVADSDGIVAVPPRYVDAVADAVDVHEPYRFSPMDTGPLVSQGLVIDGNEG